MLNKVHGIVSNGNNLGWPEKNTADLTRERSLRYKEWPIWDERTNGIISERNRQKKTSEMEVYIFR